MIKIAAEVEDIVRQFMEKPFQTSVWFGAILGGFKILSNDLTQDLRARVYEVVCEYRSLPSHPKDPRREFVKVSAVSGEVVAHQEI
jgi:hypothetical protein